MKRIISLLLLTAIVCVTNMAFKKQSVDLGGTWILSSLPGSDIKSYPPMKLNLGTGKKKMTANAICNTISGAYSLDQKAGTLQFGTLAMTWKACREVKTEQRYMEALKATTHYKNDINTLRLFRDKELVAVFIRTR